MEPLAPACEPGRPVGVQCAVAQDALCVVQGHEIGVESTVVLAACHPDVAGAQPVTQRGDHRRFVDAPLGCGVVQDDRSPVLARKRHRDDVGEGAFARAVELPEERHGGLQVVAGGGGVELEGVQERRREAAQLCVALGRQRQRVLRGQISQRGDLLARRHQTVPADLLIEHVERIPVVFAGAHHGVDGAAEQPYQPAGLRLAGRPRAVLAVPRPCEQAARQPLEQGDRRIGQRRFQLQHQCGQRSDPPPGAEIAEQVDRRDRALAGELGSSGRVDVVAEMARERERPHIGQPLQEREHARCARRLGRRTQPRQSGPAEARIVREQRVQRLLALVVKGIVDRLGRQPAGAGASGQTDALQCVRARQHEPLRLYRTAHAGQDDAPVVGVERRPGCHVHRCSHVVRRHERTEAEMPNGQPPVVGARGSPGAVAGQRWKGHLDLLGQPGDQGRGRVGVVEPALARMAQECDVERQPEAVLRAPARPDQIQIIISEQVVALQRRDVGGNPEERFAHRCWHKTS